jgi:ANTAR domain
MTLPSPEPRSNGLRPGQTSGPRQVLTDSAPDLHEAAMSLVQMPPTAAPRDLAYTRALAAASQRMWAAPDVAALWSAVIDEAMALIAADGAAVVTHTDRFWQTLAAHPSDTAPDDSATAAMIEMLFRQGLLQQPISIDDPTENASWDVVGRRALLVVRIEGAPRQPVRLVRYAGPASLSPYAGLAEAFAHHASLALGAVLEHDNLNRAVAARHRVGLAQGILMTRRRLTTGQAFALLKRESQITHVKLRTIAQTVIQTGDLPVRAETEATRQLSAKSRRGPAGTSSG